MKKSINILLLLTVAMFSLWCTGDLMRKNDQATILAGAYDLAQGRMQDPSAYYQYDKTYILYWVCAAVLKIFPAGTSAVAAANISLALIFWAALTAFVVRFRKALPPVVLLCFLTAPAVLLNTLYVNSSVLSSAFLLLSAVFLLKEENRGGWLAALFFFLSVGSRADAILLLPLLLWLITPFPISGKFRKNSSNVWKISAAGILALVTGRILCRGGASVDLFFNAKMVAGYTVFGFGAAALIFVLYSVRLAVQAGKGTGALEKLYSLAGLFALLLPVLFFLPQLHAPRYFWRGCEAVLLLAVSGRLPGRELRPAKILIALAALMPMILGVQLPALNRPQITVSQPELFPSGDGLYPMGGYIPFILRLRHAGEYPLDHNQLVWSAVHSAQFEFSPEGTIEVLHTPMYGYFMLEAALRGGVARCLPLDMLGGRAFYADSRSLMRDDPKTPLRALNEILTLPAHFVSPVLNGVGVLEFGAGDDRWGSQTRFLNRFFAGNEYRIFSSGQTEPSNHLTVSFSDQPFGRVFQDNLSGLYYFEGCVLPPAAGVYSAIAVFPQWMSLGAFKGSAQ
jgi:hypothetical protein